MFCKRKLELEIRNTDRENFNLFVANKGTFSLERLENWCTMQYP